MISKLVLTSILTLCSMNQPVNEYSSKCMDYLIDCNTKGIDTGSELEKALNCQKQYILLYNSHARPSCKTK